MPTQGTSTWTIPHNVTVSELRSRLSSTGVHPVFLLTNPSLEDEYRALVGEIGFGAVVALNLADAIASNYNDDYLPGAMTDGLEVIKSVVTHRSSGFSIRSKYLIRAGRGCSAYLRRVQGTDEKRWGFYTASLFRYEMTFGAVFFHDAVLYTCPAH